MVLSWFALVTDTGVFRPKPRKILITGSKTSTPVSRDMSSGVPLMPNLTPMTSSEALRHSPVVSASSRRLSDVINLDDDDDYYLPR